MRTLVVYYSLSGMTRELAKAIAKELGADIEEIVDPTPRSGVLGYVRCGYESSFEREAAIPLARDRHVRQVEDRSPGVGECGRANRGVRAGGQPPAREPQQEFECAPHRQPVAT